MWGDAPCGAGCFKGNFHSVGILKPYEFLHSVSLFARMNVSIRKAVANWNWWFNWVRMIFQAARLQLVHLIKNYGVKGNWLRGKQVTVYQRAIVIIVGSGYLLIITCMSIYFKIGLIIMETGIININQGNDVLVKKVHLGKIKHYFHVSAREYLQ